MSPGRIIAGVALAGAAFAGTFLIGRATAGSKAAQTPQPRDKQARVVVVSASSPKLVSMSPPASLPALITPPSVGYTPRSTGGGGGGGGSGTGGGGG
jgi:hypothetical protein